MCCPVANRARPAALAEPRSPLGLSGARLARDGLDTVECVDEVG
jgi:hypothetical protein